MVGGVLSLHWGTVTINTSEFNNNSASDMTGGARGGVIATERSAVNIPNSKFESNYAQSGGATEFHHSNITLSNIGFIFNMAENKGVLYILETANFLGSNITFEKNDGKGGVIYLADSQNITFAGLSFRLNAGSIMVLGTRMSFSKKCLFYGNIPEILSKFHNQ